MNFKLTTLALLLFFIVTSTKSIAQPLIQGMYAYTDVNGAHPLDSVQACDSVFFLVDINTSTPPANYGIYLDDTYYEAYPFSTMQQYPAGGDYKVFFKIPCNYTNHSIHYWGIGNSSDATLFIYASTTSIFQAVQQSKQGTVSIYDAQGRLVKTSSVTDYQKGLQYGTLYIYSASYSDNTFDQGKFVIE